MGLEGYFILSVRHTGFQKAASGNKYFIRVWSWHSQQYIWSLHWSWNYLKSSSLLSHLSLLLVWC